MTLQGHVRSVAVVLQHEKHLLGAISGWNSGIVPICLTYCVVLQQYIINSTFQGQIRLLHCHQLSGGEILTSTFFAQHVGICFDVSRCEKGDGGKIISISISLIVIGENISFKR